MTIKEKVKMAAVKRYLQLEYDKCMREAYANWKPASCAVYFGKAEAYLDIFRTLFYADEDMTEEMLKKLITLKEDGTK